MRDAARELASYGRHGDNMLLHVSRKELEGIRALTGREFTRNPDTGLPEAFRFSSLIPIAAGIAGTVLTGNPAVGALAAGAASAGTTAAEGGTAQQALTQGLISGATTFAGGQILSGVGEAAGAAAQGAGGGAADAATAALQNPMTMPITDGISNAQANAFGNAITTQPVASLPSGGIMAEPLAALPGVETAATGYNTAIPQTAQFAAPSVGPSTPLAPGAVGSSAPQTVGERAAAFGTRLSNIASDPGAALSQIGSNIKASPFSAAIAGGGALMQAGNMFGSQAPMPGEPEYDPNRYPEQFPSRPRSFTAPPAGYRPGSSPEFRYFAEGGLASLRKDEGYTANLMNEAKAALLGEHPRPREAIMRFRETFGDDALSLLRDRIAPGRVRGAGGGMDDLVPGSIEGRQKVRLADGEFVVPADVVSGLGDGSTDQGVRKLHGLMDKVRQQRTGKKTQPKAIGGKITL